MITTRPLAAVTGLANANLVRGLRPAVAGWSGRPRRRMRPAGTSAGSLSHGDRRRAVHRAKTASVHVSNILAKLGVSSRGEAADTAHQLRLLTRSRPGKRHRHQGRPGRGPPSS